MRYLCTILLYVTIGYSFAQDGFVAMEEIEVFRNTLAEQTSSINSIQAEFKQEKFMSILSQQLVANGVIQYKTPNMVKWSYTKPYKYDIVLNGKEIIINDDGKVNSFSVGSSKMFSEMNQLIVNSVQGDVLNDNKFMISYFENKLYYLTILKPLNKEQLGNFVEEIHVFFDKKNYSVSKLKMVEPEGDYTELSFSNKHFNQQISDEIFTKK
ncbi:MAG: outer membrane lipoprotein carrier protein LolA [Cyclobacteriaceae bacterium]|nr:outer membrane lipoprotein carrier protein LolA [Cyclobacteriaceae bacterium]